ncbi:cbb3-type cytochrome oxidase subunit 3 [Duganella callida]|uniref:CcoQ/FixQ family Cbb3-type cytochrome c oxidase assembly chaperone n=1 Tax=Duganella callida TaxID=2561932 RepID=A0A4Y9S773_9BURK|nr:CcoQ/FixQ family Cbb3-type cytochrome c oxidase assembly chaperone [Duganella callida]TFW17347.1 CcoQ/FixQ family Cbb3-type cytochrome c oxidase assembly chaperone [Duganella callida]
MDNLFDSASSLMTVISFITFAGILWWAYVGHQEADFATAARLPFADDKEDSHG